MSKDEAYYTIGDIEAATGIKRATVRSRARLYGIASPRSRGLKGYTYEEVLEIQKSPKRPQALNRKRVEDLMQRLMNDGYKVAKQ